MDFRGVETLERERLNPLARAVSAWNMYHSKEYPHVRHVNFPDYEYAIRNLKRSLELRPGSPSSQFWLGRALAASGNSEAARRALTIALEAPAFPEQEQARAELARLNAPP